MENMNRGLRVLKWVRINRLKTPQIPKNLSSQAQKFGILMKKGFIGHPQSVVRKMSPVVPMKTTVHLARIQDRQLQIRVVSVVKFLGFLTKRHVSIGVCQNSSLLHAHCLLHNPQWIKVINGIISISTHRKTIFCSKSISFTFST